jgi:hypothetical protein
MAFSQQPSVADFLKRILEGAGFEAHAVWSSGDDLEQGVCQVRPVALVYEIGFPFADRVDAYFRDKSRPVIGELPTVIATAATRELCASHGLEKMLDTFTWPTAGEVADAVNTALAARSSTSAA